jgi:hypothetical protein
MEKGIDILILVCFVIGFVMLFIDLQYTAIAWAFPVGYITGIKLNEVLS